MAKSKPVAYPNLVETMKSVVDSHAAIHTAVQGHAADHTAKKNAHLQDLKTRQMAHELLTGSKAS